MDSLSAFRVIKKLHSQPKADVLLCVRPASVDQIDGHNPEHGQVVVKLIHGSCRSMTCPKSVDNIPRIVEATQELACVNKLLTLPQHPHIVRHHSVSRYQDNVLISMEYCERGDLLTWLQQQPHKRFPEPQALAIFRQILNGVRFLHSYDIAHRDLSLENCLVTQDHTIKICDLGLATSASTLSRQHVGKLNYMAPEVVRGDYYDPVKADVWSLGIVLFMLLTGSTLYRVASPKDIVFVSVQSIGIEGALNQWGLDGVVSNETVSFLSAMLSVDLERRPRNVQAIEEAMPEQL